MGQALIVTSREKYSTKPQQTRHFLISFFGNYSIVLFLERHLFQEDAQSQPFV